jgi:hypothetical protein
VEVTRRHHRHLLGHLLGHLMHLRHLLHLRHLRKGTERRH